MSMRSTGYVPNIKAPSRQTPSREMWMIVGLCVFVPPLGLIMLWAKARNPLRGKLIVTIIALLSMTLMLTLVMGHRRLRALTMQQVPPSYQYLVQQENPQVYDGTQGNAAQQQPVAQPDMQPGVEQPQPTIIPANPNVAGAAG